MPPSACHILLFHVSQALNERFHHSVQRTAGPPPSAAPAVFTTVVGRKPSAAQYFLNDTEEVFELCQVIKPIDITPM